jgi:hypothetical protein
MQDKTINIFYQRRQNGWRKNFIYTLRVLPNRMKTITKFSALQVKVVVENWRLKAAAKRATAENQKSIEIPFFFTVAPRMLVQSLFYCSNLCTIYTLYKH